MHKTLVQKRQHEEDEDIINNLKQRNKEELKNARENLKKIEKEKLREIGKYK